MKNSFMQELLKLERKTRVDKQTIELFKHRIQDHRTLVRDAGVSDHFCSFFVPVNINSREIFIGHHIKANLWIPPGGHIDKGESPIDAVYREFREELSYTLKQEKIELIDLSIVNIKHLRRPECTKHYDFWYIVFIDKLDFRYDKNEFYQAGWYDIQEAIKLVKRPEYKPAIIKIKDIYLAGAYSS